MVKIDNRYFLDFTEKLLPIIVFMHFLVPEHVISKELLNIYRTYLMEEKQIGFSSPCIVSINADSILTKYLEKLKNESKMDLNENPFEYRKDNYILLRWPVIEEKMTR